MSELNKQDLDNWITGHWGEDQFRDEEEEEMDEWAEAGRENRARDARLAAYREEELQRIVEASRSVREDGLLLVQALRKAGCLP